MEHSETRAGSEQIAIGMVGTDGMHAENLHPRIVGTRVGYGYEVGAELVCEGGTVQTTLPSNTIVRRGRGRSQRIADDFSQRFPEAYVDEVRERVEAIGRDGELAGPDEWDGSPKRLEGLECPELYRRSSSEVSR